LPLLELNNQFFIAMLLAIGGYRALAPNAQTDIGDMVGFFFMASMFFSPISILGNQYHQAMTAMAGAERLFALLDSPPQWSDPPDAREVPNLTGHVQFDHLSFGYDPQRLVLHDISFAAEPGQAIALVGHTGSGKTSITNLIAKFYLPTSGALRIDGHEIHEISSNSLHQQMGIVLQHNFLFQGTIADNIRIGKPTASKREIENIVRQLGCWDLFSAMPDGLQTIVGERGARLSAGQRQLVCFARALIADPRILILDEATSSIDTETEVRLQNALAVLLRGRTSFVVAHRLSTIRNADMVLVLNQGRIVERGRHDQLVSAGGVYAGLYQQFAKAA